MGASGESKKSGGQTEELVAWYARMHWPNCLIGGRHAIINCASQNQRGPRGIRQKGHQPKLEIMASHLIISHAG